MPRIATSPDVAALIGPYAEEVENRSLLLDRYTFHKSWPVDFDERGKPVKWDSATRWSFIRISDGASEILHRDAAELQRQAGGRNVAPEKAQRLRREAQVAKSLAAVNWGGDAEIGKLRAQHTRRFLRLFRSAYGERCEVAVGKLEGRLAINLADSLIQNAGICLDRLFGLPYIPGSGVKGVCRHAALEMLSGAEGAERKRLFDLFRRTFGTADNDYSGKNASLAEYKSLLAEGGPLNLKGAVSFLPAYPVSEAKIVVDLTNVHYPDYYRAGEERAQSVEKPRPNPFPAVEVGARFGFCLVLNGIDGDRGLLEFARLCLEEALTIRGLGAKTASGYGWFSIDRDFERTMEETAKAEEEAKAKAAADKEREEAAAAAEAKRLAAMTPENRAAEAFSALSDDDFAAQANSISDLGEVEQKGYLLAIGGAKSDVWKTWKKNKKEKAQKRVAAIAAIAQQLGIELP